MNDAGDCGDGPRSGSIGERAAEEKREGGEKGVEAGIPRERDRGVFGDKETRVPGELEDSESGEGADGKPVDDEQTGEREDEDAEQKRETEERGGVGERQPERHQDQKDERQQRGECGDLSGSAAEDGGVAAAEIGAGGSETTCEEKSGREKEDGENGDEDEQRIRDGQGGGGFDDEDTRGDEAEDEHGGDGDERPGKEREADGERVDEQDNGPEEEGRIVEFEERYQQEQQRERREKLAPETWRGGRTLALQDERKRGVQRGEGEARGERPREERRREMFRDPETKEREDNGAAEQMDARVPRVAPGQEEKKRVGSENEAE